MYIDTSPLFAYKLSVLIESGLIDYKTYYPWSEAVIEALDEPPLWIIDISLEKQSSKAANIIKSQVVSPNMHSLLDFNFKDFFASCYYIMAESGKLSWGDFLLRAGICAPHGPESTVAVDEFYAAFEEYNQSHKSEKVMKRQIEEIQKKLQPSIDDVRDTLNKLEK